MHGSGLMPPGSRSKDLKLKMMGTSNRAIAKVNYMYITYKPLTSKSHDPRGRQLIETLALGILELLDLGFVGFGRILMCRF